MGLVLFIEQKQLKFREYVLRSRFNPTKIVNSTTGNILNQKSGRLDMIRPRC